MIQIIAGKKGSGKTKRIIDMTNEKVKDSQHDVVFIDDDNRYMLDIDHKARFINASEYKILTPEMFLGFLCGMLSQNFDVGVIFIDAFKKLEFEAQFQHLSPGGAISYVEVPDMQNNLDAVLEVMKFIYDHIIYAELNTKSDYCQECGYEGEIQIIERDSKLIWHCPQCGNEDQDKMNVARRTCGYIGTQFWNQGRTQEIKERVLHL